ncbi:MAG: hypothetical protein FK734_06395 [Asgard group archaeon]|nr:hypothetical protein [Asgard group archaeon]
MIKSIGLGIIEGGIAAGLAILLLMVNFYVGLVVLVVWLIFGWISTYIIKLRTIEILPVILSGGIVSALILYFVSTPIWQITILAGMSILFWSVSFTTKILIFPSKKQIQNESSNSEGNKISNNTE